MRKHIILLIALPMMFIACETEKEVNDHPYGVEEELQPLYDDVMAVHDEVMPQMGLLAERQEQVTALLKKQKAQNAPREEINATNRVLGALNKADHAMMTWMQEFQAIEGVKEGTMKIFLETEKQKVNSMRNTVNEALAISEDHLEEHGIDEEAADVE